MVDTGGLVFDDDSEFLPEIREQAALALEEASVAVVIVDGQQESPPPMSRLRTSCAISPVQRCWR